MSTDLVPTLTGRPSVIQKDGLSIYVSVHDTWFLSEAKRLYQIMLSLHPDKVVYQKKGCGPLINGHFTSRYVVQTTRKRGTRRFNSAKEMLGNFLARERDGYYRQINLDPPNWSRWCSLATEGRVNTRSSRPGTVLESAINLALLSEGGG
jgi:hypothetical protein